MFNCWRIIRLLSSDIILQQDQLAVIQAVIQAVTQAVIAVIQALSACCHLT